MTANRSTVEGWLRKLEAASEGDDFTGRARTYREIIADVWADGRDRGYADHGDDVFRGECARKKADREAASKEGSP